MSNLIFPTALGRFSSGDIDWANHDIRCSLIFEEYVYDASDEYLDDIGDNLASTVIVDSKTIDGLGKMSCDDFLFPSVPADGARNVNAVIVWRYIDNSANSPVIAYIDDAGAELPILPDGNNIPVTQSPSGLIQLSNA